MSTACCSLTITQAQASVACRPVSKLSSRVMLAPRSRRGVLRSTQTPRASLQDVGMLLAAAAEDVVEAVKPGSVEAPTGALIAGAIVVTLILTAGIPALLNPGTQAAEKIFDRDGKTGRR
ncbi:g11414 [Coccomyxa viridis]|uniref:G11414 protein n=1 Tax=Coccomyxa viridis TaxID=1274662 RepID=A0ABP1GDL6_9CHLO